MCRKDSLYLSFRGASLQGAPVRQYEFTRHIDAMDRVRSGGGIRLHFRESWLCCCLCRLWRAHRQGVRTVVAAAAARLAATRLPAAGLEDTVAQAGS